MAITDVESVPNSNGVSNEDFFDELPPALVVDTSDADIGQCQSCGLTVRRPAGKTPGGRQKRIPKYCDDCKNIAKTSGNSPSPRRRKSSNPDIQQGMTDIYTTIGMLIFPKDPDLGMAIIGEQRLAELMGKGTGPAPSVAEAAGAAWAHVAASNPAVAAIIEPMLKTSVWAELLNAHTPIVARVLAKLPKRKLRMKFARWRKPNRRPVTAEVMDDE